VDRDVRPIDDDGNGLQRARQDVSMSIGREGAICEQIEIMFKSSRFERRCEAYKMHRGFCASWQADEIVDSGRRAR